MDFSHIYINGEPLADKSWLHLHRPWFYGDSLFETIRFSNGSPLWPDKHWERLVGGMRAMHYEWPEMWDFPFFLSSITRHAGLHSRVRFTVWREQGGLYRPASGKLHFAVFTSPLEYPAWPWPEAAIQLALCETVRLPIDHFSRFKTLNASRYVAAALEAKTRGCDDLLILNSQERPCESISGNIFWIKGNTVFTPPLQEGCIDGVMRSAMIEIIPGTGLAVRQKPATLAALESADEVFLTNVVRGIQPVGQLGNRHYHTDTTRRLFNDVLSAISIN